MQNIISQIKKLENPERVENISRFFKTGKGQYGEGDIFLGIYLPDLRKLAKKYSDLNLSNLEILLQNKYHEVRLFAVIILINQFESKKTSDEVKTKIYNFYLENIDYLNNWDFIDISAHKIIGKQCNITKNYNILFDLANSDKLFRRRASIISTFAFIKNNELDLSIQISKLLLKDKHDLIHKAVGWVLREVAKKNKNLILEFIKNNYSNISRTTLRYTIEKFPKDERENILKNRLNLI
jgi:3-methyladenine DNA glycosylase AlkD